MGDSSANAAKAKSSVPVDPSVGFLQVAWRGRWMIIWTVAICLLAAAAYLLLTTRQHTATVRLLVNQTPPRMIGENDAQRASAFNPNFLNTEREVLRSTPVLAIATSDDSLNELKVFDGVSNRIDYLRKELEVEAGRKDDFLTVAFAAPDPEDARKVAEVVADAYLKFHNREKRNETEKQKAIINDRKVEQEDLLKQKQEQMTKLLNEAGTFSFDNERHSSLMRQLDEGNARLTAARSAAADARRLYEEANAAIQNDERYKALLAETARNEGPVISSDLEFAQIRGTITEMENQLEQLRRDFTPDHPVRKSLENRLARLRCVYVLATKRHWAACDDRIVQTQKSFTDMQKDSEVYKNKWVQYRQIESEANRIRASLDRFDSRIEELSVDQEAGAMNISINDPARVDPRLVKPSRTRTLAIALVLGLLLGVGGANFREWVDARLHTVEEIKFALGLPVLGLVPRMDPGWEESKRAQTVRHEPSSPVAEAYRNVRTAVHFRTMDKPARSILVTSPGRRDGKTTLAANLAIASAQAGKRVLLVDADLRRPVLHERFDVDNVIGLASVLHGEDSVEHAIQRTAIEGVDILPAGPLPQNPTELLNSDRFSELLISLCSRYDQVIFDSPPVTSVSDARIVAASCDGTLMVIRATKTPRKLSEQACDGLMSVGARILGVVVNDEQSRGGDEIRRRDEEPVSAAVVRPAAPASETSRSVGSVPTPDFSKVR